MPSISVEIAKAVREHGFQPQHHIIKKSEISWRGNDWL